MRHDLDQCFDAASPITNSEPPRPLVRGAPPPEPYPIKGLGKVLGDAAAAIQDLTQAPMAICAQSVLATATLAAQGHADIEMPTGQIRPISGFFLSVAESGERKSGVDELALRPVSRHESNLREKYDEEHYAWKNEHDVWEKQRQQILNDRNSYADRKDKRLALEELGPEPRAPLTAILTCSEPTVEGLQKMMIDGQPSIGVYSAEGGQFIGGHGMSHENKLRTATSLSNMWDGAVAKRVRAGDGAVALPGRRFSLHLMAQPTVMATLLSDPVLVDQGLLSRVLLTAPAPASGSRFWREPNPKSNLALGVYASRLSKIFQSPMPVVEGKANELKPRVVRLSPEARRKWIAFSDHVEGLIGPGGELEPIKGLANKLAEHSARIATVLALIDDLEAEQVSGSYMDAGIDIVQHHAAEALRLFAASAVSDELRLAEKTLLWLRNNWGQALVSLPNIYQSGPNAIRDKRKASKIVEILVDHGWLEPIVGGAVIDGKKRRQAWKIIQGVR